MRAIKLPKRFKALCASVLILTISSVSTVYAQSGNLTDVVFSTLSGGDVQINFVADGQLPEPGTFSTDRPARIAIDFFGMKSLLENPRTEVGEGKVESVVAVQTPDRTRLIINLLDTAQYKLLPIENGYSLTVFNTQTDSSRVVKPKPFASRPDVQADVAVTNIDFRRSEAGGGKLVIDLNDDNATIDTRERDGEIIVDLLDVTVPAELEQRLDVTDFATPVQTIDSFQNSSNVRMVIVPTGKYQHLSFQAGKRFTLVVDPIIETPEDLQNEADAELGFSGDRLSINFQDVPVRQVLAVIADFTGINFVTSDSVQGNITINLSDVPWDQALEVVLRTEGLSQRQTGNVVWVAPTEEIQRTEEEELRALAVIEEFAPLSTEIIQINYARAEEISEVINSIRVVAQGNVRSGTDTSGSAGLNATETDINSLLSARGSVTVDERTNSLLVQDVPEKIRELRNVIAELDKPVRQVLIETRIVSANDNFSRELGARLGFQRVTENALFPGSNNSDIGDVVTSGSFAGNQVITDSFNDPDPDAPLIFDTSTGTPGGLAVDLGANAIGGTLPAAQAFNIFRSGTGFASLINLELSALEADGRGRIVASPRLITSNQQEAFISQGQSVFITVPGNGNADGGGGGGVEEIEIELRLTVTPQITPDDRVIMDVNIIQDTIVATAADINVVNTTEIQTEVLSDNGETIVIGGIYEQEQSEGETKVPFLGDIPFLGNLFRQRSKTSDRQELLIFLTPKIITPKLNLG